MSSRRGARNLATTLLLTAAGVALGVLWAAKRQPASVPVEAAVNELPVVRVVPPRDEQPELTAVPHATSSRLAGADDYEAISPEELSAAFLSRATESRGELANAELSFDVELEGFQIATIEDLTVPELSDDPADFEVPGLRRGRKLA